VEHTRLLAIHLVLVSLSRGPAKSRRTRRTTASSTILPSLSSRRPGDASLPRRRKQRARAPWRVDRPTDGMVRGLPGPRRSALKCLGCSFQHRPQYGYQLTHAARRPATMLRRGSPRSSDASAASCNSASSVHCSLISKSSAGSLAYNTASRRATSM
jgi:hypothetical protein